MIYFAEKRKVIDRKMLTFILLVSVFSVVFAQVSQDDGGELDSMNCIKTLSHQLSKKTPMTRRVSFDLIGIISILMGVKKELNDFDIQPYNKEPSLAMTHNLHRALLFGARAKWTESNNTLLMNFGPEHRLVLDIMRIVSDPDLLTGLCLIEKIETDYQNCVTVLTRSWNAINSNNRVKAPSFTVSEEQVAQASLLIASSSALAWLEPDSAERYQFLVKRDYITHMIFHLRKLVNKLLAKMIGSLDPFLVYSEWKMDNCNYFIFVSILRGQEMLEDDFVILTNEKKEIILSECRLLSQELKLRRSSRSLLSWLFSDHGTDISNLILAQHNSIAADKVLEKNQRTLAGANYVLSANLLKLSEIEQNNSEALLGLIRVFQTRETLHFVENTLRAEKLSFVSSLRDLNNQLSHLASEAALLMQRLVADLSPSTNCNLDSQGRGVSCAPGLSFVDNLKDGQLLLASQAHLYERSESFIISCLFLDSSLYGYNRIFIGNRLAFLKSDSFFHHRNVSAPIPCFKNVTSTQYRCNKYIAQWTEGADILPPMSRRDFNFILTTGYVYIQAVSGTVTLTFNSGSSVPVAQKPFRVNKSDFPIFINGDQFLYEELSGVQQIKPQTEFFLSQVNDNYFHFTLPQLATSLASDDLQMHWDELEENFKQNPIIQAISVTSLVLAVIGLVILVFAIFVCCRKRVDKPRLYAEWYRKAARVNTGPPLRPPKPAESGSTNTPKRSFFSRWRKSDPSSLVTPERRGMLSADIQAASS